MSKIPRHTNARLARKIPLTRVPRSNRINWRSKSHTKIGKIPENPIGIGWRKNRRALYIYTLTFEVNARSGCYTRAPFSKPISSRKEEPNSPNHSPPAGVPFNNITHTRSRAIACVGIYIYTQCRQSVREARMLIKPAARHMRTAEARPRELRLQNDPRLRGCRSLHTASRASTRGRNSLGFFALAIRRGVADHASAAAAVVG